MVSLVSVLAYCYTPNPNILGGQFYLSIGTLSKKAFQPFYTWQSNDFTPPDVKWKLKTALSTSTLPAYKMPLQIWRTPYRKKEGIALEGSFICRLRVWERCTNLIVPDDVVKLWLRRRVMQFFYAVAKVRDVMRPLYR